MIIFIVKADDRVGFGHLSRSTALAAKLKNFYNRIYIYGVNKRLKAVNLNPFTKIFSDKSDILSIIKKKKIKKIIIDKKINTSFLKKALKNTGCKIIQINNDPQNLKNVDFTINHLIKKKFNSLGGIKYLIIRTNLINKFKKLKYQNKTNILVSLGASFNFRYYKKVIELINTLNSKEYKMNIILPSLEIKKKCKSLKKKIKIIINPTNQVLKEMYKKSNIGISSGGMQLSEMIANQIITIPFPKNKTEKENINFFANRDFCHSLNKNLTHKNLCNKIKEIINNQSRRKRIEKSIIRNFELNGAFNTAQIIKNL